MKQLTSFFVGIVLILGVVYLAQNAPASQDPSDDVAASEDYAQAHVNLQMRINDLKTRLTELEARCKCGNAKQASGSSRVRTYFFTTQGCQPCEVLKKGIINEMVPLGWSLGFYRGENPTERNDIEIVEDQSFADRMGVSVYPTVVVTVDGQEVSRTTGVGGGAGALSVWINQIRQQVK